LSLTEAVWLVLNAVGWQALSPGEAAWIILNVIWIDLVLAIDNALVIAAAVQNLDKKSQNTARWWGAFGAASCRILFLAAIFWVLKYPMLHTAFNIGGGAYIIYIGIKLLKGSEKEKKHKSAEGFWQAIRVIIVADALMSLDNVLAVFSVSKENLVLASAGIVVSVPMVIYLSRFVSLLMEKFSFIIVLGALILGKVGGEMVGHEKLLKPYLEAIFQPFLGPWWHWAMPVIGALIVFVFYLVFKFKKNTPK